LAARPLAWRRLAHGPVGGRLLSGGRHGDPAGGGDRRLDALDRGHFLRHQACRRFAWWKDGWQKLSEAPYRAMARLGSWIEPFPEGIYVRPADAWIDPSQPKERALVTHGHSDHARGGHGQVWATPETLAIMATRYGEQNGNPVAYGESFRVGEVEVSFVPAGHVLGSAQIVLDHAGERIV